MTVQVGPKISVIIPVYNGAEFVTRCLDAVLTTQGVSYECIVVNDTSTDASATLAAQFSDCVRLVNLIGGPRGPAYARNRGAELARGEILFFVDADVVLLPGALERVAKTFANCPGLAAVFGSYDADPTAKGLISRYRNLLHHFVHQNGNPTASTFWAGCGAIRKSVFETVGGFDEKRYPRASIEDIELGYRLRTARFAVFLDKDLRGKHLKSWSLYSLIRTDIISRAQPWARLILETRTMPDDLNLKWRDRVSFGLVALSILLLLMLAIEPLSSLGSAVALLIVVALNRDLYAFFYRQGNAAFAAGCILLHLLYYFYSGVTYVWVWAGFHVRKIQASQLTLQLRHKIEP
jgi:glycosyltransferase involved in cell wall biosynthesis